MLCYSCIRSILQQGRQAVIARTISDVPSDLYSFTQLDLSDIDRLLKELPIQNVSQWYTHLNFVTTISSNLLVKSAEANLTGTKRYPAKRYPAKRYPAVLPFQVCSAGIVSVCAELKEALRNFKYVIDNGLFDDSEPGRQPVDTENPSLRTPMLFASARISGLTERKMRRIALPEFMHKIKLVFEQQKLEQDDHCRLLLHTFDFQQCGFYSIPTISVLETREHPFVRVEVTWSHLHRFLSCIHSMDGLLCDLLIFSNDHVLRKPFGRKLNLFRVKQKGSKVSKNRAVDPILLKNAIEQAYTNSDDESENERQWTDGEKSIVEQAVKYTLDYFDNGFSNDNPLKFIHCSHLTFHLLNLGKGEFKTFRRRVRSVSESGYRVRSFSFWMWVKINLGVALPIMYVIARHDDVSFEELIGTAISLVALFIATVSPLVLQIFYRGESLLDVLSNIRNIDSQEEFDTGRTHHIRQLADILEVIRMAHSSPQFLGGQNMSYLGQGKTDLSFDAHAPLLFPNLELLGFALYEDDVGEMYMLDKWFNLFEVWLRVVSEHVEGTITPTSSSTTVAKDENLYLENATSEQLKMNICCLPIKREGRLNVAHDDGYIVIKYNTPDGHESKKNISRLVPYGVRKRKVERGGWRLQASVENWEQVANADILVMEIGKTIFDDVSQV